MSISADAVCVEYTPCSLAGVGDLDDDGSLRGRIVAAHPTMNKLSSIQTSIVVLILQS